MEDINGKKMLAMDVFTMAIRYMREHLMNALKKQVSDIQQSDVLFVITVPAIWSDASKQFMREAAIAVRCCFIIDLSTARLKWRLGEPALSDNLLYALVNRAYANSYMYYHHLVR